MLYQISVRQACWNVKEIVAQQWNNACRAARLTAKMLMMNELAAIVIQGKRLGSSQGSLTLGPLQSER